MLTGKINDGRCRQCHAVICYKDWAQSLCRWHLGRTKTRRFPRNVNKCCAVLGIILLYQILNWIILYYTFILVFQCETKHANQLWVVAEEAMKAKLKIEVEEKAQRSTMLLKLKLKGTWLTVCIKFLAIHSILTHKKAEQQIKITIHSTTLVWLK